MDCDNKYMFKITQVKRCVLRLCFKMSEGVAVRETDKMAAEAINGLFGRRQFVPIAPLRVPAKHATGKQPPDRGGYGHRQRVGGAGGGGSEKSFTMELPEGCEAEPCQHNGDCYTDSSSPHGFTCHCLPGFSGDFCEIGNQLQ